MWNFGKYKHRIGYRYRQLCKFLYWLLDNWQNPLSVHHYPKHIWPTNMSTEHPQERLDTVPLFLHYKSICVKEFFE